MGLFVAMGPARADLIAEYNFDQSSGTAITPTVGSVTGTLSGSASLVPWGVQGGAVSISSAGNGVVDLGHNFTFSDHSPFSVQLWVNTTDGEAGGEELPFFYQSSGSRNGYGVYIGHDNACVNPLGTVAFYNSASCSGSSNDSVIDGNWHQIVAVYSGSAVSIYIDGALQSAASATGADTPALSGTEFLLGGVTVGGTPLNDYQGLISDLQIYDSALSAGDIAGLYSEGLATIPEPASLALLATGLLGFGLVRHHRKGAEAARA